MVATCSPLGSFHGGRHESSIVCQQVLHPGFGSSTKLQSSGDEGRRGTHVLRSLSSFLHSVPVRSSGQTTTTLQVPQPSPDEEEAGVPPHPHRVFWPYT